jgi:hypothetical protein
VELPGIDIGVAFGREEPHPDPGGYKHVRDRRGALYNLFKEPEHDAVDGLSNSSVGQTPHQPNTVDGALPPLEQMARAVTTQQGCLDSSVLLSL